MKITRDGVDIELTKDEVYEAYKEHFYEMCKSDVRSYLEDEGVQLSEKYIDGLADLMPAAHEAQVDMSELFDIFRDELEYEKIDIHDMDSLVSYFGEPSLDDVVSSAAEKVCEQGDTEPGREDEAR